MRARLLPSDIERAEQLYAAGRTMREVADAVGISPSQLSKRLRQAGVRTRGNPRQAGRARSARIRQLRLEKMTWTEIGFAVGLSAEAARQDYLTRVLQRQ